MKDFHLTYRRMVFHQVTIVHCHKHDVRDQVVQNHVHMYMMLLFHFPVFRPKIQQYYAQVNRENYTVALQRKRKICLLEYFRLGYC